MSPSWRSRRNILYCWGKWVLGSSELQWNWVPFSLNLSPLQTSDKWLIKEELQLVIDLIRAHKAIVTSSLFSVRVHQPNSFCRIKALVWRDSLTQNVVKAQDWEFGDMGCISSFASDFLCNLGKSLNLFVSVSPSLK